MSKYIKLEDIETLITACEWRMTLAKERHGEGFVDYSKQVLDVDELTKRLSNLPTIEVSEDCISLEDIGKTLNEWLDDKEMARFATKVLRLNAPRAIPTTEQSSMVGEWISQEQGAFYPVECSNCHKQPLFNEDEEYEYTKYCPYCGAKMNNKE